MAKRRSLICELYLCSRCRSYTHTIYRGQGNARPARHPKNLWCPMCRQKTRFRKV